MKIIFKNKKLPSQQRKQTLYHEGKLKYLEMCSASGAGDQRSPSPQSRKNWPKEKTTEASK